MTRQDEQSLFKIDIHNLDQELIDQVEFMEGYGKAVADARRTYEEAKANLDVVYAELDKEIRQSPKEYGLEKITETQVKTTIQTQQSHKDALQEVIDARHSYDILQAAVTALEHRKSSLEKLVSLYGMQYFSNPKVDDQTVKKRVDYKKKDNVRRKGQTKPKRKSA